MAINLYNIKKWYKMLTGKSVLHVNQDFGKQFRVGILRGYFNNLTEKVIKEPDLLTNSDMPVVIAENGEKIFFPVAIFQYGLGAYDLYLETGDRIYLNKFEQCAQWAVQNQEDSGAWNNFFFIYPEHPYGAMCQGEGASLLVRAYKEFDEKRYYDAAVKALDFLITPVELGGPSLIKEDQVVLLEYTHRPAVLNGWIFALFGIYDFLLVEDNIKYQEIFQKTVRTLAENMTSFDGGYWSIYDLDGKIASGFYHNLHIAQMHALFLITENDIFSHYEMKWKKQQESFWKSRRAFIVKAFQKILEK